MNLLGVNTADLYTPNASCLWQMDAHWPQQMMSMGSVA